MEIYRYEINVLATDALASYIINSPFLLTWINFTPSMGK